MIWVQFVLPFILNQVGSALFAASLGSAGAFSVGVATATSRLTQLRSVDCRAILQRSHFRGYGTDGPLVGRACAKPT